MAHEVDIEKHRREETRWRVLKVLDAGRPWPVAEGLVMAALDDVELSLTVADLRKQIRYLADKQLVTVHGEQEPTWLLSLTAAGTDVVEYTAPVPPGIRRPKKWG